MKMTMQGRDWRYTLILWYIWYFQFLRKHTRRWRFNCRTSMQCVTFQRHRGRSQAGVKQLRVQRQRNLVNIERAYKQNNFSFSSTKPQKEETRRGWYGQIYSDAITSELSDGRWVFFSPYTADRKVIWRGEEKSNDLQIKQKEFMEMFICF